MTGRPRQTAADKNAKAKERRKKVKAAKAKAAEEETEREETEETDDDDADSPPDSTEEVDGTSPDSGDGEGADGGDGEGVGSEDSSSGDTTTPPEGVSKEAALELFTDWQEAADVVEQVLTALEEAHENVSTAIEAVYVALGAGPFRWKGKELRIAQRKGKFSFRTTDAVVRDIGD